MPRRVSALFRSRALADAAAGRLAAAGYADASIVSVGQGGANDAQPGMFDRLAKLIAPEGGPRESGFLVSVDADPDAIDAAAVALEQGSERVEITAPPRLTEQVVEVAEIAEQLVVEKQPVLREEIVMRVEAREHVEDVHETVRRTEAEIERFVAGDASRADRD